MQQRNELALAGTLHDIGALSLKERLDCLQFESENHHKHEESSYLLLKMFEPLSHVATLVRFHHFPWGDEFKRKKIPIESNILHLADRIAVLVNEQQEILGQVKIIRGKIESQRGKMFMPELVDVFGTLSTKECFWLDVISPSIICSTLSSKIRLETVELGMEGLLALANMFRRIIDFKSHFTATHSSGVASSAEALAKLTGFSDRECRMMKIAGYFHDLGKLAVPVEILEKPEKLTDDELNIIRSHTFYTYRILEPISDLDIISSWAAFHHERLDGTGYPFHHKGQDLSIGSRIMAVADVFTAITEDRPYRKGMDIGKALQIIELMADSSKLDARIASLLKCHFDEINANRISTQISSVEEYKQFMRQLTEHQE